MEADGWSTEEFRRKWREQAEEIGQFNLAIFGKTGVGKSTLVNAVFGEEVAHTGIGEPITMERHLYRRSTDFFGLLDTRGLEIGKESEALIAELDKYVKEMRNAALSEQVHVAWYCVRSSDRRFEDTEADFVRRLDALGLPVVLVLTQVPSRNGILHPDAIELADHIAGLGLPIANSRPVHVNAQADAFRGENQHGLQELLDATFRIAPDGVRIALTAAQKVDLARKRSHAHKVVLIAGAAVGGVSALGGPDFRLTGAAQLALTTKIAAVYGVDMELAATASTLTTATVFAGSKWAVKAFAEKSPDGGDRAKGLATGITAGALTLAVGYGWMAVCDQLAQGNLVGLDGAIDHNLVREVFFGRFEEAMKDAGPMTDPVPEV